MSSDQLMSSEQLRLPESLEEVTAPWISSILGQEIKAIELTKAILNASASKLFITLTYDDENAGSAAQNATSTRPTTICVKGGFNPVFIERYTDILIGLYKREADFFNRVAPSLIHIDLPRSYWAGNNSTQGIVIMDDLEALGATFGEPVNAWPVERVMAGVEQLAGLHAGTWGAQHSEYPFADPQFYDQIMMNLCSRWDALIHAEHRPPLPDIVKDEKRITAALRKHFASRNPRFLDWQTIQVSSAFHDVAYFISGSLTVEDRRAHEMRILEHYLDALSRFGGPSLSGQDEEVTIEYRKSMLAGYNWILAPYELQNEGLVRTMCERHATALVDHKTVELLESLPQVE
ncbi:kinase-like domain-containing protein [Whalleya microplaca]|nr:kinase-like domain-containing protein [Whalleya microplaca]